MVWWLASAIWIPCLLLVSCQQGGEPLAQEAESLPSRPNIILVMTDDQGYGDLSCHGHPFLKTPHLDRLYAQSTRFTDFHASPTCAPSRAALMAGKYPFKLGISHTILERERMALSATTIAEVLQQAGYSTGIFGKWHLGEEDEYQPENRGFDEVFIHGAGGIGQDYPGSQGDVPGNSYFNPIIKHNGTFVQTTGYCTDVFFQQTLSWIRDQTQKSATPFFAYLATNAPHSPYIVADEYQTPFAALVDEDVAAFYGMIVNIDENMGLLMQKLDEWDLAESTLLIFMTDNGTARSRNIFNAGMKGGKASLHEGGSRVPLFMRWPGHFKAEADIHQLTRHIDIFPTLAQIAGADTPTDLDGRSLLPLIDGSEGEWPEDRVTFFHKGRWNKSGAPGRWGEGVTDPDAFKYRDFAVRSEQWRLVGKDQLYNIQSDPGEDQNVIESHPELAASLLAAYDVWWGEVRPLLINEDASLETGKPFVEQYEAQLKTSGVPAWKSPEL